MLGEGWGGQGEKRKKTMYKNKGGFQIDSILLPLVGGVPTNPDPITSAKASRYKWEAYRDTIWLCIYYFLLRGGHTFAEVSR